MRANRWLMHSGVLLASSVLFALGMNMFLLPGGIIFGGFTGIATILYRLFGLPTGTVIALLNVPLLVLSWRQNGARSTLKTLVAILATSAAIDSMLFFPTSVTDPLLCAVFGGCAIGLGVGLLLRFGYTTGGTDLIAYLLRGKIPNLSTGKLILAMDALVTLAGALVTRELSVVFYSVIGGFCFSRVVDGMLLGADRAVQAMIFTEHAETLAARLLAEVHRGVTLFVGEGAYTHTPRPIIFCVVRPGETARVRQLVSEVDPTAFLVFGEVSEVRGRGFREIVTK